MLANTLLSRFLGNIARYRERCPTIWERKYFVLFPFLLPCSWKLGVDVKKKFPYKKDDSKLKCPVSVTELKTETANSAFQNVLKFGGASFVRDAVGKRIIAEVESGKDKYRASFDGGKNEIIDSQVDMGGWPELKSKPAQKDSDNDGMPDDWEIKNNLNPNVADNNGMTLDSKYTNIEIYLNSLVKSLMIF